MSAKSRTEPAETANNRVSLECGYCGAKGGAYAGHYDVVRCRCGKTYWALRPMRFGPLKLVEHPGIRVNGGIVKL